VVERERVQVVPTSSEERSTPHIQRRFDAQTADWRAIRRGALIAGAVWLALSLEIILSNVVFPSGTDDDTVSVVAAFLCIFAALFLVGHLAARNGAGPRGQAVAGAITDFRKTSGESPARLG
jgi:hypothetical protein